MWDWVLDEDDMASDSDEHVPTQQSTKAYIDAFTTLQSADDDYFLVTQSGSVTTISPGPSMGSGGGTSLPFNDGTPMVQNSTDNSKTMEFNLSVVPTAENWEISLPVPSGSVGAYDMTDTMVLEAAQQTVISKILNNDQLKINWIRMAAPGLGAANHTTTETITGTDLGSLINFGTSTITAVGMNRGPLIADYSSIVFNEGGLVNMGVMAYLNQVAVQNQVGDALNMGGGRPFYDMPTIRSDSTAGVNAGNWNSFRSQPIYTVTGSGSPTITAGTASGFVFAADVRNGVTLTTLTGHGTSGTTIAAGASITTINHLKANQPLSMAGTVTTQYGLDIDVLTGATTNIGIRNNSSLRQVGPAVFGSDTAPTTGFNVDVKTGGMFGIRIATLTLANGSNDNVSVTSSVVLVSGPTAAFEITGFTIGGATPTDGAHLTVINNTGFVMTIKHDVTSTAANRVYTFGGVDSIGTGGVSCARFIYDAVAARWWMVGAAL